LIYQNETVSKPAESGEIEQQACDRGSKATPKRSKFCLNANALCGKRESSATRLEVIEVLISCDIAGHAIITESCNV